MIKFLLFILLFYNSYCYNYNNVNIYYENMINKVSNIYSLKNKHLNSKDVPCILFIGGASGFVAPQIYSDFLKKISENKINIYCPPFNYENKSSLINSLSNKYKEVILMGHSSGGTIAINYAKNKLIKKLILLDPVDTRFVNKDERTKNHDLLNLNSILFLTAEKSYKINFNPFGLPFIPILSLSDKILNLKKTCKVIKIKAYNNGHGDILDSPFSNFVHNSRICVGTKDRNETNLNNYKNWMSYNIKNFINLD